MVERLICIQEASGSNPDSSIIFFFFLLSSLLLGWCCRAACPSLTTTARGNVQGPEVTFCAVCVERNAASRQSFICLPGLPASAACAGAPLVGRWMLPVAVSVCGTAPSNLLSPRHPRNPRSSARKSKPRSSHNPLLLLISAAACFPAEILSPPIGKWYPFVPAIVPPRERCS